MKPIMIHCYVSVKGCRSRTPTSEQSQNILSSSLNCCFFSSFCHICKADNPTVEASENGTQAIIRTHCNNPRCNKEDLWYSQPQMPGLKIPAGNFFLALSILLAGGSATKVFKLFSFMGIGCVSLKTFFKYQRVSS